MQPDLTLPEVQPGEGFQMTVEGQKADQHTLDIAKIGKEIKDAGLDMVFIGDPYYADENRLKFIHGTVEAYLTLEEFNEALAEGKEAVKSLFKCHVEYPYCDKGKYGLEPVLRTSGEVDSEYKRVCQGCRDSIESDDRGEPIATVYFDDDDEPHGIGYYHDDTDGAFKPVYKRLDGWRGYYNIEPSDDWELAHTDCILAHSADAENLKEFDDALREILGLRDIKYARVFTKTSNIFSMGYDFFVEAGKGEAVGEIVEALEEAYRDPQDFRATALTGKDKKDRGERDELFVLIASVIQVTEE